MTRELINYDDTTYIAPIEGFDLSQYFQQWLFRANHQAFPLKDFTFWIDFKLSKLFGIQFFWISNFLYFVLFLAILYKLGKVLFPKSIKLVRYLIAVIAFHPLSVEVVQWASMRKHLLVSLFIATGTLRALELRKQAKAPSVADWSLFFLCYGASLLCYPTGIFWMVWVIFVFREEFKRKRKSSLLFLGLSSLFFIGSAVYVVSTNFDFSLHLGEFGLRSLKVKSFDHWLESIGRGYFNLLFPVWIAAYYTPGHIFSWLGLGSLLLTLYWFATRVWKQKSNLAVDLMLLAVTVFAPSFYTLFNSNAFVLGDRHIYVGLPYFIFSIALILPKKYQEVLVGRVGQVCLTLLLLLYGIRSAIAVNSWTDDVTLMKNCFQVEGSPRCLIFSIEKEYEYHGCASLPAYIAEARKSYSRFSEEDMNFRIEVPFYEGLCVVTMLEPSFAKKKSLFDEVKSTYRNPDTLIFPEVILYLRENDIRQAQEIAFSTYLNSAYQLKDIDEKFINIFAGQAHVLCELSQEGRSECEKRAEDFYQRYSSIPLNSSYSLWGGMMTMEKEGWDPALMQQ